MPDQEKIQDLTDNLKSYLSTNYELIRLQATERASVIGSGMISSLLIGFAGMLFLLCITLVAGFYLSAILGDSYSGFAIVAGFYLIVVFILVIGREKLIERPMRDKITRTMISKN
jgi:hypothetical protein